jgi:hypothetical protein
MYLSYSPCANCADFIIDFSKSRPQCLLSVVFSCLFRHEEVRHRDGLRRLYAAPKIFLGVFTGTFFENYSAVESLTHSVTDWNLKTYWGFVSSGMCCWLIVSSVVKQHGARTHLQGLRSVKMNPATQRHVPEVPNPQQNRCENLKSHRIFFHPTKII